MIYVTPVDLCVTFLTCVQHNAKYILKAICQVFRDWYIRVTFLAFI